MPSFVLTDVWPLRTDDGDNNVVEFGSQWWWWIGLKLARKFKLHRSKPIIHMKFWWRLRLMNTSNLFGKKKIENAITKTNESEKMWLRYSWTKFSYRQAGTFTIMMSYFYEWFWQIWRISQIYRHLMTWWII